MRKFSPGQTEVLQFGCVVCVLSIQLGVLVSGCHRQLIYLVLGEVGSSVTDSGAVTPAGGLILIFARRARASM